MRRGRIRPVTRASSEKPLDSDKARSLLFEALLHPLAVELQVSVDDPRVVGPEDLVDLDRWHAQIAEHAYGRRDWPGARR